MGLRALCLVLVDEQARQRRHSLREVFNALRCLGPAGAGIMQVEAMVATGTQLTGRFFAAKSRSRQLFLPWRAIHCFTGSLLQRKPPYSKRIAIPIAMRRRNRKALPRSRTIEDELSR
jgi:hypothetical protein